MQQRRDSRTDALSGELRDTAPQQPPGTRSSPPSTPSQAHRLPFRQRRQLCAHLRPRRTQLQPAAEGGHGGTVHNSRSSVEPSNARTSHDGTNSSHNCALLRAPYASTIAICEHAPVVAMACSVVAADPKDFMREPDYEPTSTIEEIYSHWDTLVPPELEVVLSEWIHELIRAQPSACSRAQPPLPAWRTDAPRPQLRSASCSCALRRCAAART